MQRMFKIGFLAALTAFLLLLGAFMLSKTFVGRLIFPLPFVGPHVGTVVDCVTGEPIAQALVTGSWWCHDNPFPDSPGQFTITVTAVTGDDGGFVLPKPRRRGGFFSSNFNLSAQAEGFVRTVVIFDPTGRDLPQSTKKWPFVKTRMEKALPEPLLLCLEPELPVLIKALHENDAFIRTTAATQLAIYGLEALEAFEPLLGMLDEEDAGARQAAAQALGAIGEKASPAFEKLLALTDDPDEGVRAKAAKALGEIGTRPGEAVELIVGLLADPSSFVREAAVGSLLSFGLSLADQEGALPENEPDLVTEQITDQPPGQASNQDLARSIVQALVHARDDESWRVRDAAASAISQMEQLEKGDEHEP